VKLQQELAHGFNPGKKCGHRAQPADDLFPFSLISGRNLPALCDRWRSVARTVVKSSGPCGSRMHEARKPCEEKIMLYYALVFLVIAIIAGILGFTGIAGTSAWIAHVLFVIFLVLFIVSLIFRGRPSV
jgi:uncharacterized membrane protein YtjA (UPF0391 family)